MRWNATTPDANARSPWDRTTAVTTASKSARQAWSLVSTRAVAATSPVVRFPTLRGTRRSIFQAWPSFRKEFPLRAGASLSAAADTATAFGMGLALP
jgi:hypothetical protein